MIPCSMCGNNIALGTSVCPFCETRQAEGAVVQPVGFLHKTVNLEQGRPLVEAALNRLERELQTARHEGVRVLTLIHGYGSSGIGGAIRRESRRLLADLLHRGQLNLVIPGEEFRAKAGPVRDLLRRFPPLSANVHLNRGNRGITIVVL